MLFHLTIEGECEVHQKLFSFVTALFLENEKKEKTTKDFADRKVKFTRLAQFLSRETKEKKSLEPPSLSLSQTKISTRLFIFFFIVNCFFVSIRRVATVLRD
jgi:hypothetical protein